MERFEERRRELLRREHDHRRPGEAFARSPADALEKVSLADTTRTVEHQGGHRPGLLGRQGRRRVRHSIPHADDILLERQQGAGRVGGAATPLPSFPARDRCRTRLDCGPGSGGTSPAPIHPAADTGVQLGRLPAGQRAAPGPLAA